MTILTLSFFSKINFKILLESTEETRISTESDPEKSKSSDASNEKGKINLRLSE